MTFRLRLMFEWGGGCLWCMDDATRQTFGVGPIENRLPLSAKLNARLEAHSSLHDSALNWDDPAAPSPWMPAQFADFDRAVEILMADLQAELGGRFVIEYAPLGADRGEHG